MVGVGSGVFTQLSVIGLTKDRSRRGKAGPGVKPEPVVLVFCPEVGAADVEGMVGYTAGGKCWDEGEIMYIISPLVLKNEILYIISPLVLKNVILYIISPLVLKKRYYTSFLR